MPTERHPREQHEYLEQTQGASSRQTCRSNRSGDTDIIETTGSYYVDGVQYTFDRTDSILRQKNYTRLERDVNAAWIDGVPSGGKGKASQYRYHSTDLSKVDRDVHHWKGKGHEETNSPVYGHQVQGYFPQRIHETVRER